LLYRYTIQEAEVTNAIGIVIATLIKYKLLGSAGDSISLYRTREDNWYDMKETGSPFKNAIMVAFKISTDQKEKMEFPDQP